MAPGDLATLEAVRAYLRGSVPVPADDEAMVEGLITAVSAAFVSEACCDVLTATYTDTFDGDGTAEKWLKNYPVTGVDTVAVDDVSISERAAIGEDGWVLSDADGGKIELVGSCFTKGVKNCSVGYSAGYGATAPADVAQAVVDQVAYLYKSKERVGISNETTSAGGSVTYLGAWKAQQGDGGQTPLFAATVARYRRVA